MTSVEYMERHLALIERGVNALDEIAYALKVQNTLHQARNKTLKENSLPPMEPRKDASK